MSSKCHKRHTALLIQPRPFHPQWLFVTFWMVFAPPLSVHRHSYGLTQVPNPSLKSVKLLWHLWQPFVEYGPSYCHICLFPQNMCVFWFSTDALNCISYFSFRSSIIFGKKIRWFQPRKMSYYRILILESDPTSNVYCKKKTKLFWLMRTSKSSILFQGKHIFDFLKIWI